MNKERLKEIMYDQKDVFDRQRNLIHRDIDIKKHITSTQVIIISGVRRCGKSSLMHLIKEKLKLKEDAYCYFNFDDERIFPEVSLLDQLYNLHLELYGKEPILFLDEIQNAVSWEKFVNRMYEKGIKVYVTGSNAKLLSSEISSSLTGRNKVIRLFPFSFSEYLRFLGTDFNLDRPTSKQKSLLRGSFNNYFKKGGFPLVIKEDDLELINSYFQDILYRDIISRYKLTQINEIKEIGLYFTSNVGKLFSYSTLQKISGVKSLSSIKDYLEFYKQSYLFYYLKKFDYSVKKQIMNPKKVYTIDPAFISRLGFSFSQNKGRILENIIYLELIRQGKEVFYHSGKNKCDFVIKEGLKIIEAIQVTYLVDEKNYEREYKGLNEAMEVYNLKRGTLITYSDEEPYLFNHTTFDHIPAWRWLLSSEKL